MGIMALGALSIGYGRMFAFTFSQLLFQIRVAREAEWTLSIHCHPLEIGSMRVMTGKTHPISKGLMVGTPDRLFHKIPMALGTHFGIRHSKKILFVRPVGMVAGATEAIHHRFMRIGPQKLSFGIGMAGITGPVHSIFQDMLHVRPVRIMASATFSLSKCDMRFLDP
jgi:hypothetical protein